ncbi:MAG TPA: hypothetical protein VIB48_14500 [Acidimicrobiia bacterium]
MADVHGRRPAFYAARPGGWRDWWTILHLPYTTWHLSYVVIGAALAPHLDDVRLIATLLAFFCAVGVAAHALDELHGHPLRTQISDRALWFAAGVGLACSIVLGIAGLSRVGPGLAAFIVIGPVLLLAYNLELFGGRLHTDLGFATSWGAFPVLTSYFVQAERLDLVAVAAATAALGFSLAQRRLSTPARFVRRHVTGVDGTVRVDDGSRLPVDERLLLAPLEQALRALSWSMVVLAVALVLARTR